MPPLTDRQSEFLKVHLGSTLPVSAEENEALAKLPPEELANTDLTKVDVTSLFDKDAMNTLRETEFKGEGTPALKDLMNEIGKGFPKRPRAEVMQGLEAVVGIPPDAKKLNLDYDRFLIVKKQQEAIAKEKDKEAATALDADMHPEFMGSRGQLMCGKVLGDSFGIHEVFGSLLNPTGGLVGPGNHAIHPMIPIEAGHLDPDNPIAIHGTVHDAAGYLNTYHNDGPGYNYLDSDIEFFGTGNPLSGQISGIAHWTMEAGDEYVVKKVDAAALEIEKALKSVRDAVSTTVDKMMSIFDDQEEQAEAEALETAAAIMDAAAKASQANVQARDAASPIPGPPMEKAAKEKLDAMSGFIW
ncbi:MAG: hypothetical protein AAF252_08270 [Pseudomonadota bacterium]